MILCIVGPTAVGKTKLSVALAKIYNGEIINADSVQVYQNFDIGSAKATKEERQGVPHHLLDVASPEEDYTIFQYQADCRKAIAEIQKKGKIPILVGGSVLYLKAALYDYEFAEEQEKDKEYPSLTNEELYQKILEQDPNISIDFHNRRRLLRVWNKMEKEVYQEQTMEGLAPLYDDVYFLGLKTDTETLYQRINERVDGMLVDLVDEVYRLYEQNIRSKAIQTAIGYKELYAFFDHTQTFRESVEQIKQNTRNYAKRQFTFFEHQLPVQWFDVNYGSFDETIQSVVNYLEEESQK